VTLGVETDEGGDVGAGKPRFVKQAQTDELVVGQSARAEGGFGKVKQQPLVGLAKARRDENDGGERTVLATTSTTAPRSGTPTGSLSVTWPAPWTAHLDASSDASRNRRRWWAPLVRLEQMR
jgi:hypothetical protein